MQVLLAVSIICTMRFYDIGLLVFVWHRLRWISKSNPGDIGRYATRQVFEDGLALVHLGVSKCVLVAKMQSHVAQPQIMTCRLSRPLGAWMVVMSLFHGWVKREVIGVEDVPSRAQHLANFQNDFHDVPIYIPNSADGDVIVQVKKVHEQSA